MSLISKISVFVNRSFFKKEKKSLDYHKPTNLFSLDKLLEIKSTDYYKSENLIFFKEINSYCAFKFDVVKEILHSSNFGISDFHISLNKNYFQKDHRKHNQNKKVAINYLRFASKKHQFDDFLFINNIFPILKDHFPKNESFDLITFLIQPLLLSNALNELGLLKIIEFLDPNSEKFNYQQFIQLTTAIFQNRDILEDLLQKNISLDNLPFEVKGIVAEMNQGAGVAPEDLPNFLATLIFVVSDSATSFVSSMVYFVLKEYPDFNNTKRSNELTDLANELLRLYTPNPYIYRTVNEDVKFHNVHLKKGDNIVLFLGSANRDPSVFVEPERVIFGREQRHLAFGRGHISCIGEFAAFRMARNILNCLSKDGTRYSILTEQPNFVFLPILKISEIKIIYHD